MAFFGTFAKPCVFFFIENTPDNQSADFTLHYRSKVFRSQQTPIPFVQNENRVCFAGDGLNAVKNAGDKMIFTLITIIDVAIMVIIGYAEAKNQTGSTEIISGKGFILQEITDFIM